jgi:molybdopterin-containing oxidoreductase family membrane subunit
MAELKAVIRSSSEKLPAKVAGVAKAERVTNPSFNKDAQ